MKRTKLSRLAPAGLTALLSTIAACAHPGSMRTADAGAAGDCGALSAAFELEDRFVTVTPRGLPSARMRYVEKGSGDRTFLLLHGIPTSAYLWRNVIPGLSSRGRVIAVDLVGFGRSERPATLALLDNSTQAAYLSAFVEALGLSAIVPVLHDLGSTVGLAWASQHAQKIERVVMLEALIPPLWPLRISDSPSRCGDRSFPPDHPVCFFAFVTSPQGQTAAVEQDLFLSTMANDPVCAPSAEALRVYREPFPDPASRKHLLDGPRSVLRIEGLAPSDPAIGADAGLVDAYSTWLKTSTLPKLLLYVENGFLLPRPRAESARQVLPNLEIASVGTRAPGGHFLQEGNPEGIARAIVHWIDGK